MILGVTIKTYEKIRFLKRNKENEIYVIDYTQTSTIKERDGVIYLSPEGASSLTGYINNITFHHYMYILPGTYARKGRRKEE